LQGIFESPDGDADIFSFFFQSMDATGARAVATAQVQVDKFGTAAGRREIFGDRPQRGECQPSFLLGFAVCNLLRLFILVDQAGDHFHQPRVIGTAHGAYTKLLDQHHFIALRVVRQYTHGIMTNEDFAVDHTAHAAVEFLVAQLHAIKLVEALVGIVALNNLDGARRRFYDVRHIPSSLSLRIWRHPNALMPLDAAPFQLPG